MRPKPTIRPAVYFRFFLLESIELGVLILALLVVQQWWAVPNWLFWSIVVGWIIKDVVLFPFVWRAYDQDTSNAAGSMIGEVGFAKSMLDPSGYIQVRGELWKAVRAGDGPPIEEGSRVRIHHRKGLTLYVRSDNREPYD
jgi:membrane-bound ClpP family serine protease